MRSKALAMSAVLTSAAASPLQAQQVSVADGDWSNIPPVQAEGKRQVTARVIDDIAAAAQKQSCPAVRNPRHIELSVPFLVQFSPAGSVEQIVLQRLGCPQVESLIAGSLLQMAKEGEYRPTLVNQTGWYRGSFDLSSH